MTVQPEIKEIVLEPNWEVTTEWFARGLAEHAFQKNSYSVVASLLEQARYLALTDPDALERILNRLDPKYEALGAPE